MPTSRADGRLDSDRVGCLFRGPPTPPPNGAADRTTPPPPPTQPTRPARRFVFASPRPRLRPTPPRSPAADPASRGEGRRASRSGGKSSLRAALARVAGGALEVTWRTCPTVCRQTPRRGLYQARDLCRADPGRKGRDAYASRAHFVEDADPRGWTREIRTTGIVWHVRGRGTIINPLAATASSWAAPLGRIIRLQEATRSNGRRGAVTPTRIPDDMIPVKADVPRST